MSAAALAAVEADPAAAAGGGGGGGGGGVHGSTSSCHAVRFLAMPPFGCRSNKIEPGLQSFDNIAIVEDDIGGRYMHTAWEFFYPALFFRNHGLR
eukprot:SAG22_NODE_1805_length_3533_cov_1.343040_1_plen_95_part_00